MPRFRSIALSWVAAMSLSAVPALAQDDFPNRPIMMIMGWSAGGMGDTMLRSFSKALSKVLGQPVVVENKPGATGILGLNAIMQSAPDGYTLGYNTPSNYLITPNLQTIPVDYLGNSTQIGCVFDYPFGLVVRADAPWRTWNEFKEYAKRNPGKVSYATAGVGTAQHIAFERIAQKEGIQWTHIPYKGGNDTVSALVGGHIDAAIQGPADVHQFVQLQKLRMLLALGDARWDSAPDVPSILELGYDFSTFSKGCIHGPKNIPEPVRAKLEAAFKQAVQDPDYIDTAKTLRVPVIFMSGKEYSNAVDARIEGYKKSISALGLRQ